MTTVTLHKRRHRTSLRKPTLCQHARYGHPPPPPEEPAATDAVDAAVPPMCQRQLGVICF